MPMNTLKCGVAQIGEISIVIPSHLNLRLKKLHVADDVLNSLEPMSSEARLFVYLCV